MMATTSLANPMANSNLYMNPQTGPSPPETYPYRKTASNASSTSITPTSQTPPSNNISPTNYHSNVNARQLRQPRQPLYVPAALRPNDRVARPTDIPTRPRAPDTPPASKDNSFDSARTDSASAIEIAPFLPLLGQGKQDEDDAKIGLIRADSEQYAKDAQTEVEGLPTTAHWKPDESSNCCYICSETFTWFFRRHHCRKCGQLVCSTHIQYSIPLDHNARYHPQGTTSKACKPCYDGWKLVKKMHHSRTSSIAESSNSSQGTAMPIPNLPKLKDNPVVGSIARSEGGMVWSTF